MTFENKSLSEEQLDFRLRRMKCFLDDKEGTSPKIFIQNSHRHHLRQAVAKMGAHDFDELT